MSKMKLCLLMAIVSVLFCLPASVSQASSILDKIGVTNGICVVLGDAKCELAIELALESELLIYMQFPGDKDVQMAHRIADAAGLYGTRIYIDKGTLTKIHLADNLADAVVAVGKAVGLSEAEVLRVLRPKGKALLGPKQFVKPVPEGIDDWSHWHHRPDNNPVSTDTVIKRPYITKFLALPYHTAMPSHSVVSGGRMFRASGHMAHHVREEKYLNTLYANNSYNGELLWTRPIPEGFMAHRSMFVATADKLYLMEPRRCVVLEPETGKETDEISVPPKVAEEGDWMWMALEDGVLYALLGPNDLKAQVTGPKYGGETGWSWDNLSPGYYGEYRWGFGNVLVAINTGTKDVLWSHRQAESIDSRSVSMANDRLFFHGENIPVTCLDKNSGKIVWKNEDSRTLKAIAERTSNRWKTIPYTLCIEKWLFFAASGRSNVVCLSAEDGQFLWSIPGGDSRTNAVFCDGYLYAHLEGVKKIDPVAGKVVKKLRIAKQSCTRMTGNPEAIFHRGSIAEGDGTTRYDLTDRQASVIHAFRPPCHDGVIAANGLLHFTQWQCDCNLQMMGWIALAPAGNFEFNREAIESERLELSENTFTAEPPLTSPDDWATYRANNHRSCSTAVDVSVKATKRWQYKPSVKFLPSAPTAAGGLVFIGGKDCQVRAIDAATGLEKWRFRTAGSIRIPPTIWNGRAYVGSADGCIYALEAATGRLLWRFRAAPVERKIMVYGSLSSAWPVNTGVLIENGMAYAAAGIINCDGTHMYALDARTGSIKWQNNDSGHLNKKDRCGVSVQGDLAVLGDKLIMAGGNVVSPGTYNLSDGKCLNEPTGSEQPGAISGSEVAAFMGKYVMVGGDRLFDDDENTTERWRVPAWAMYKGVTIADRGRQSEQGMPASSEPIRGLLTQENPGGYLPGWTMPAFGNGLVAHCEPDKLVCASMGEIEKEVCKPNGAYQQRKLEPTGCWNEDSVREGRSVVVAGNAVVVACTVPTQTKKPTEWVVQAFDIKNGDVMWTEKLDRRPLKNGICVDKNGRIIIILENGNVVCIK